MRCFQSQYIPKPKVVFSPTIFNEQTTIDLEIGAGQGLHSIKYAISNPDRTLIAVEQTKNRHFQLAQRLEAHRSIKNLIVIRADAVAFTVHFIPDNSLNNVFILYPNPYPKQKQSNLRWYNRSFFGLLMQKVRVGGQITLATNLTWYAEEANQQLEQYWQLDRLECRPIDSNSPPRTHFEKKYLSQGHTCWNLKFQKPNGWKLVPGG